MKKEMPKHLERQMVEFLGQHNVAAAKKLYAKWVNGVIK